jgi:hypothetical protein
MKDLSRRLFLTRAMQGAALASVAFVPAGMRTGAPCGPEMWNLTVHVAG